MALSSSSGAEYLDVRVFLYKYTPKFTFVGEHSTKATMASSSGAASQDAIQLFKAMIAKASGLLALASKVSSNPDINNASRGILIPVEQQGTVLQLIDQYASSVVGNSTIFAATDITNNPSLQSSLSSVLGSGFNKSASSSSIAAGVVKKLPLQGISSQSLLRDLTVPAFTTVTTTGIQGQQGSSTTSFMAALKTGFSHYQGYPGPQIFSAWLAHANALTTQLSQLMQYANTLGGAAGASTQEQVEQQFKVGRYRIDLSAPRYFSKFDLTPFLKEYSVDQALQGNEYRWTTGFQDVIIPFSDLDPNANISTVRKPATFRDAEGNILVTAKGPPCRTDNVSAASDTAQDLVYLMAEYEAESTWPSSFAAEVSYIKDAFLNRGTAEAPFATNSLSNPSSGVATVNAIGSASGATQADGLRLSDLLQKYNFISVFVYKSNISPSQAQKALFPKGVVPVKDSASSPADFVNFDKSNEVHLMLAGYRNEFNGFITEKAMTRVPGQVDRVTATGHGILRLFSDTLSLYDASILAQGIYSAAELVTLNPSATLSSVDGAVDQYLNVFENRFQGKDPIQIIRELLAMVYRVYFTSQSIESPIQGATQELQGFYDIKKIVVNHDQFAPSPFSSSRVSGTTQRVGNLFTIAPFLVALVMALRNYNYNLNTQVLDFEDTSQLLRDPDIKFKEASAFASFSSQQFYQEFGGPCVQISDVAKKFNPYFVMLKNGFSNFVSTLKSPNDIMNEVIHTSMLEFYERPNGRIILRTPQYNQAYGVNALGVDVLDGNAVTSNDTQMMSAQYSEDGTGIKTRKRGSYSADLIGLVGGGLFQPSYATGKMMMQYGFREGEVESNPNLRPGALAQIQALGESTILNLVHKYVRFLLEIENAALKAGVVTMDGDPRLEVGKLFFDLINRKVGYIIRTRKNMTVGGTYQATVSMRFVRDLGPGDESQATFRQLPTLEELVTMASTDIQVGAPSQPTLQFAAAPVPSVTTQTIEQDFSQLTQSLSTPTLFTP